MRRWRLFLIGQVMASDGLMETKVTPIDKVDEVTFGFGVPRSGLCFVGYEVQVDEKGNSFAVGCQWSLDNLKRMIVL